MSDQASSTATAPATDPAATKPAKAAKSAGKPATDPAATKPAKAPEGPRRYEIAIEGGFKGVFSGHDPEEAQRKYFKHFGVRSTTRKMTCEEVTDDPDAKLASELHDEMMEARTPKPQ